MSGFEVAGISLAVIDQLLKLGDKTIAIIADAKDFEAVKAPSTEISEGELTVRLIGFFPITHSHAE
jgi:hypothetical protein